MKARITPTRAGTPARTGTPIRGGSPARGTSQLQPEFLRQRNPVVVLLIWLAVLQAIFCLLPIGTAASRLLGIALALGTLLAVRIVREPQARRTAVLNVIAVLIVGNMVMRLIDAAPNFPFRMWQVAMLLGYTTALLAQITAMTRVADIKRSLTVWGVLAAVITVVEGMIGGPADFSPTSGKMQWIGATVQDSALGVRFAPNATIKSTYPDSPRGYFDEPDALQRRWVIQEREGSKAALEFPADRPGILRVNITDAPGKVEWHLALAQSPIRVVANERYEVRFRARADSSRTIIVAVAQAHEPWRTLGLYREVRIDTAWRDFTQTFRATEADRVAQLYFNLGLSHPSVEFSSITMRGITSNKAVQAEARRELSVSYHINSQGCRGPEYPVRSNPGSWRILSLGDGKTFGVGVHQRDTYGARLEGLLNESGINRGPEDHYDVINCGVRGYSTQQERRFLGQIGSNYAPNVVLLAVNPDDDQAGAEDDEQPSGTQAGSAGRLFRLWGIVGSMGRSSSTNRDFGLIVDGVKNIDADVRAMGSRLAIVLLQHRQATEWTSLDSALTKGLTGSNVPILNLGPMLLPFGEENLSVHPQHDWHPNELAHRVAAEALRKFLADQGLLGSARAGGAIVTDTSGARR